MKKLTITTLTVLTLTLAATGQTFIDQIRVGQKMPDEINKGGYTEEKTENCTCRIFSIKHNVNPRDLGGGGAVLQRLLEFTTMSMTL